MPNFNIDVGELAIYMAVFLFSLSLHEAAHAWTSERFGDTTGRYLGRVTLNPIAHIDPIGTIVVPLLGFILGGFMFGWAKPVPVNPLSWRNRKMANIWTSAAGPISNFILVILAFIAIKLLISQGIIIRGYNGFGIAENATMLGSFLAKLSFTALTVNVILGVFNMIPVPPLDGSHILQELLPREAALSYEQLRPWGMMILIALMVMGAFNVILSPVMSFVKGLI